MTRHALIENFTSRDITLVTGELVIVLDNERENIYTTGYHHVMVMTRHGRKVRMPRMMLGREQVLFSCQLCDSTPLAAYKDYVSHLIDLHMKTQLTRSLDYSKDQPACPFPSCTGMIWPVLDNLLYHYAPHHHVLDKVMMYETEVATLQLRDKFRIKERIVEQLAAENQRLREAKKEESEVIEEPPGKREGKEASENVVQKLEAEILTTNLKILELKKQLEETSNNYDKLVDSAAENIRLKEELVEEKGVSAVARIKVGQLTASVRSLQSKLKLQITRDDKVSSTKEVGIARNNNGTENDQDLVEKIGKGLELNEKLKVEVDNVNMQNESLKNIIEIGRSTVEAAKKISHDLAEENKGMKEREKQINKELLNFNNSLKLSKQEYFTLSAKYDKLQGKHNLKIGYYVELQERLQIKNIELQKLQNEINTNHIPRSEYNRLMEKCNHDSSKLMAMAEIKDDLSQKLAYSKEEVNKRDNEYKVLLNENVNANNEIKTLKNQLNSNRSIMTENAVARDQLMKLRTELSIKTDNLEKSDAEVSIIKNELKEVLDNKCGNENDIIKNIEGRLKKKTETTSLLMSEVSLLKKENIEIKERLEFYVGQCSEFENIERKLQEEISMLQSSIKDATGNYGMKVEDLLDGNKNLKEKLRLYEEQQEALIEENRSLNAELLDGQLRLAPETDNAKKYNLQCALVDELMKKHEKLAAQLHRKDWEIVNYQKKLDSAFESRVMIGQEQFSNSPDIIALAMEDIGLPEEEEALNLCTRQSDPSVKVEVEDCMEQINNKRKFGESSTHRSIENVTPITLRSNLDTSHDSTPCRNDDQDGYMSSKCLRQDLE